MRAIRWLERSLLVVGFVCLAWAGTTWLESRMFQREQSRALELARVNHGTTTVSSTDGRAPIAAVTGPIGRLVIPRLEVSVIVMPGEDEATLRKAVGHLSDTPLPWNGGNTALAGHRDTFFRPLEHVRVGDHIQLDTPHGRFGFRVHRTVVVDPEDMSVLEPSATPTLTLITCYPFRVVGPAPKRFVVQARRV